MNKILEMLENFIEGQLELEPEHYIYTSKQVNNVCRKIENDEILTDDDRKIVDYCINAIRENA